MEKEGLREWTNLTAAVKSDPRRRKTGSGGINAIVQCTVLSQTALDLFSDHAQEAGGFGFRGFGHGCHLLIMGQVPVSSLVVVQSSITSPGFQSGFRSQCQVPSA